MWILPATHPRCQVASLVITADVSIRGWWPTTWRYLTQNLASGGGTFALDIKSKTLPEGGSCVVCTLQMWSHLSTPFTRLPYRMSGGGVWCGLALD